MTHGQTVGQRRIAHALRAGRRWQQLIERRATTVRLLSLGGPKLADQPERVSQFVAREEAKRLAYARAGVTESFFTERRIGPTLDLDDNPPNETARTAGVPVGRIVDLGPNGEASDGFATGFLIARNLILTNHHVFATPEECRRCGIQFGYEKVNGVLAPGTVFALDTKRFFYANETLDFAVVGVAPTAEGTGAALQEFGSLNLIPTLGKILVGHPISIIQYPEGGPKKYGVRDNELLIAPSDADLFLQYSTDTLPGSSGSPAFNKDWEVVGLHHSGVPEIKNGQIMTLLGTAWNRDMPDSAIHWIANEGVRVSRMCQHLAGIQVSPDYRAALADLLSTFKEDFASLPAVKTQTGVTIMDQPTPSAPRGVSISVNGPANFYFGGASASIRAQPPEPAPAPGPATVESKLRFDPNYAQRPGYQTKFLGVSVPLPGLSATRKKEALKENGKVVVLKYHHYSIAMNERRKLLLWSAMNADYTPTKRRKSRSEFGTDTWIPDPRIRGDLQIQDQQLYDPAKKFDRGHIVSREDTAWGETVEEETFANSDSFHFTNSTPQHENFNRAVFGFHGLWGGLEIQIQSQAKNVGNKMCLLGGPILDDPHDLEHDFGGGPMKIPRRFWKVVLVTEQAETKPALRAFGFILDQTEAIQQFGVENFSADNFAVFQVPLSDITKGSGVTFNKKVLAADAMQGAPHESRRIRIVSLDQVRM